MPGDFPLRPLTLKGALVVFEGSRPIPSNIVVFQYNPETVSRSLQEQLDYRSWYTSGDTDLVLPPTETFQFSVELDAAEQLEDPRTNPVTVKLGLHPALAALELLMYPPSTAMMLEDSLARDGAAVIKPAALPKVLLVWGVRVAPVRVTSISINEQAFDQLLNPIQARVDLSLRTLTIKELKAAGPPFNTLAFAALVAKEVMARRLVISGAERIRGLLPF